MEKMKQLYEKVAGDSGLQEKFAEIMKDAEAAGETATKEKLMAFAKEAGFEISFDEVREYAQKLSGQEEGSLSDTELDLVAGGKSKSGEENVVMSLISLGIGCAATSLYAVIKHGSCKVFFE